MDPQVALYLGKLKEVSMEPQEMTESKLHVLEKMLLMQLTKSSAARSKKSTPTPSTLSMPLYFGTWSSTSIFRVIKPFTMKSVKR